AELPPVPLVPETPPVPAWPPAPVGVLGPQPRVAEIRQPIAREDHRDCINAAAAERRPRSRPARRGNGSACCLPSTTPRSLARRCPRCHEFAARGHGVDD